MLSCSCCIQQVDLCGACCLLRHAEGRYEVQKPNEDSERFEYVCQLKEPLVSESSTDEYVAPESLPLGQPDATLAFVGVFDGIGSARRALDLLGITPALYLSIEIDAECVHIVRRTWPDVVSRTDLTDIREHDLGELLQEYPALTHGLIVGGLPCQPFSALAAGRTGFDDPRSNLLRVMIEFIQRLQQIAPHIQWHDGHVRECRFHVAIRPHRRFEADIGSPRSLALLG